MTPKAKEILRTITEKTGDGLSAQGHDLFPTSLVLDNAHLFSHYDYVGAVTYLMRLFPTDAADIARETSVEQ
jgi:hypothetical protein